MTDSLNRGPGCRVESKFSKPDTSLTNDAIEYLRKTFHAMPHAGVVRVNHIIAAAVKDGVQRNAVESALVQLQKYGWIKLSIPAWGGVIGQVCSNPKSPAPQQQEPTRWYFGGQEFDLRLTEYFYNPSFCQTCAKLIGDYDYDRSECHDCRSPKGKLADLEAAIKLQQLYGNDDTERISEWPTIRAFLRDKFGPDRTDMQLWEGLTDCLRVLGWQRERWLRMTYGGFIALLQSGLLYERQPECSGDSGSNGESVVPQPPKPKQTEKEREVAYDQAILGYGDSAWKRDETLNNKAWRVRKKKQGGELFGDGANERGWYQSRTQKRPIKKDEEGNWVYLTAPHSKELKDFFSSFVT